MDRTISPDRAAVLALALQQPPRCLCGNEPQSAAGARQRVVGPSPCSALHLAAERTGAGSPAKIQVAQSAVAAFRARVAVTHTAVRALQWLRKSAHRLGVWYSHGPLARAVCGFAGCSSKWHTGHQRLALWSKCRSHPAFRHVRH